MESILEQYGIREYFSEIHTNPAFFDSNGLLQVDWHHGRQSVPHNCPNCSKNMCKGKILDSVLQKRFNNGNEARFEKILYVGDGSGDFCPSLRLQ